MWITCPRVIFNCERYVASLYLHAPIGNHPDRVFPPINCFVRATRRETKSESHRNKPAQWGKIALKTPHAITGRRRLHSLRLLPIESISSPQALTRTFAPRRSRSPLFEARSAHPSRYLLPPSTTVHRTTRGIRRKRQRLLPVERKDLYFTDESLRSPSRLAPDATAASAIAALSSSVTLTIRLRSHRIRHPTLPFKQTCMPLFCASTHRELFAMMRPQASGWTAASSARRICGVTEIRSYRRWCRSRVRGAARRTGCGCPCEAAI